MTIGTQPFARKKTTEVFGRRMAYIDEGEGAPIVFAHGNPTSSYLWRNIMPACAGLGRLVACDMLGMGDSEKLPDSGPDRYTFAEQRRHLFALWEKLGIDRDAILVLHDWGSALGFDWANRNREKVQGIAYMESFVMPLAWDDFPAMARDAFRAFRSPAGEELILQGNAFVEHIFPSTILRPLAEAEMAEFRRPFANAGEDRRPTLTWPRQIPLDGEPADVAEAVRAYGEWLATSTVPKLYIHAEPGALDNGRPREFCRQWPNQIEVTVPGIHFIQEDSPGEIGAALAAFVRRIRGL